MTTFTRTVLVSTAALALLAGPAGAYAAHAPAAATLGPSATAYDWQVTPTGSTARFRGLAPVSTAVAWVSGTGGTVLRTTDGGEHWTDVSPKGLGTETLQFRDIEATSDQHAVILSIGSGEDSRILVTDDAGATWTESFRNEEVDAFYDCMAFTTPQRGLAMSDPVGGVFRLAETTDGGHSWAVIDAPTAQALPGEYGFAASGTCLAEGKGQRMYLATGGVDPARVLTSADRGHTWTAAQTPVLGGAAAGIFSVSFKDAHRGVVVGGDYLDPTSAVDNAAWSDDGGVTWHKSTHNPAGYRSGSAWLTHEHSTVLAVGPSGSDVSTDAGRTWAPFDDGSFDSVECTLDGACWASGEQGRVAVLTR